MRYCCVIADLTGPSHVCVTIVAVLYMYLIYILLFLASGGESPVGYGAVCPRSPLLVPERQDCFPLWCRPTLPTERVEQASDGALTWFSEVLLYASAQLMSSKCIKPPFLQKSVPCDLCKEVLMVVEQLLKDNATEVCWHDSTRVLSTFRPKSKCLCRI